MCCKDSMSHAQWKNAVLRLYSWSSFLNVYIKASSTRTVQRRFDVIIVIIECAFEAVLIELIPEWTHKRWLPSLIEALTSKGVWGHLKFEYRATCQQCSHQHSCIAGGYHGYWPADYYSTNGHFGTADDLKHVIATYQESGQPPHTIKSSTWNSRQNVALWHLHGLPWFT